MQNDKEKFKKDFIKRLVSFSLKILKFSGKAKNNRVFWPVIDQLIRSATSVGANVIEAKSSSSKKDYIRFFEIALKSANETKYWLILIKESDKSFKEEASKLLNEINEISNIIGSSILTLKGKK
jgi:four helix bundle protein